MSFFGSDHRKRCSLRESFRAWVCRRRCLEAIMESVGRFGDAKKQNATYAAVGPGFGCGN